MFTFISLKPKKRLTADVDDNIIIVIFIIKVSNIQTLDKL